MKRTELVKSISLALALLLCLSLTACGGSDSGDESDTAPETFEGLVIDDSVAYDYSGFFGTWIGEDDAVLTVEDYSGTRFDLSDADDALLASGNLQYVERYGYVYAYNEHDGIAYQCWFDGDNALHIESVGIFTKVSGDVPGETIGDEDSIAALAGRWFLNGDENADCMIYIRPDGTWEYLTLIDDDNIPTVTNSGTIADTSDGGGEYCASSVWYEDEAYDFYVIDGNTMYFGEESEYYARLS